jgi:hypothetical protein
VRVELTEVFERLGIGPSSLFEQVLGLVPERGEIGVIRERLSGHGKSPFVTPVVRRSG